MILKYLSRLKRSDNHDAHIHFFINSSLHKVILSQIIFLINYLCF